MSLGVLSTQGRCGWGEQPMMGCVKSFFRMYSFRDGSDSVPNIIPI